MHLASAKSSKMCCIKSVQSSPVTRSLVETGKSLPSTVILDRFCLTAALVSAAHLVVLRTLLVSDGKEGGGGTSGAIQAVKAPGRPGECPLPPVPLEALQWLSRLPRAASATLATPALLSSTLGVFSRPWTMPLACR